MLDLTARLARDCERDPQEPRRIRDAAGHTLLVDEFAAGLIEESEGAAVESLVAGSRYPAEAYAILCVLVQAGALRAAPAPPPRPPARRVPIPEDPPLVSCVIVNTNAVDDLPGVLRSLRAQTYPRVEVIVSDNDSTDGSVELLEREFPEVRAVRLARNSGFFGALNAGIEASSGRYVACLNTDLELDAQALAAWVEKARQNPRAAVVGSKMMLASNPRFLNSLGNSIAPDAWGFDNFMGVLDMGQFDHVQRTWSACFGAALLDRQVIDRIGPLDSSYFLYYDDLDWSYRVRLAGYDVVMAPDCVVFHQFGGTVSKQPEHFKMRWVVRNRVRYSVVNMSPALLRSYLPHYVLQDTKQVARALLGRAPRGQLRTYGRAYTWLFMQVPEMVRIRRRRRSLKQGAFDEREWTKLNFRPPVDAHEGGEAKVGFDVAREWYVPLFKVPRPIRAGA